MPTYLFEREKPNCLLLEQELGLARGDITYITIYPEGAVEVETREALPAAAQDNLRLALEKRGLAKGKKPER